MTTYLLITFFTWIGGIVSVCGASVALLWIIEFTCGRVLKALDWWKPFFRFVWMSERQKEAWREDAERVIKEVSKQ